MTITQLKKAQGSTGLIPKWYTKLIHNQIVKMVTDGNKLQACKLLCDLSTGNNTREVYGLEWSKKDIVDNIAGIIKSEVKEIVSYTDALSKLRTHIISDENKENINSNTATNAFEATHILSIIFDKTKEDVMKDYIKLFN